MPQTTVGLPSQISPMTDFTSTTDPLDTYSAGSAGTFTPFSCSAGYSSCAIPGHRNSYSILWLKFGRLNGHTTPYPHYIIQSKNVNKQKCTHQTKHIMLFSFYSWWVKKLKHYISKRLQILYRPLHISILRHIEMGVYPHSRSDTGMTDWLRECGKIEVRIIFMESTEKSLPIYSFLYIVLIWHSERRICVFMPLSSIY